MPSISRDQTSALLGLRRRVATQSGVDAGEGVSARRVLFLAIRPVGDLNTALDALDAFERAIVEDDNRLVVEARRLKCLAILDRIIEQSQEKRETVFRPQLRLMGR
ncbi:hypothetical protein [Mesorhizobium sp.]|uniref:hypothetical protein n=1 Tax=Mesorhizobium sp. TaxID=1871066 RepID=UPI0025DF027F|nr:hypothetical protein [Mesorhizobium sp.]